MRAFIIRPFGEKSGMNFDKMNFNTVENVLIAPALERLNVTGRTTLDIMRAGNIHADMFQRLLTADLIVADISIHNANVYYELGIRHALLDKKTFMIRCSDGDPAPFDIATYRYLEYDRTKPEDTLEALIKALDQTINNEVVDSPVFKMLPNLKVQNRSHFLTVPADFREEVELAEAAQEAGDLELFEFEAHGFEWETEGLRVIGRAQVNLNAHKDATPTWENLLELRPRDCEALRQLGTIYQKLGDLTRSNQRINTALEDNELEPWERAELFALLGSNAKTRWLQSWQTAAPERQREKALGSAFLDDSINNYQSGFDEDLNHYYSGLNALALMVVKRELATQMPEVWGNSFESEEEAAAKLKELETAIDKLKSAVAISVKVGRKRAERTGENTIWAEISECDWQLLFSKKPQFVAGKYRNVLIKAKPANRDIMLRQIRFYRQLDILSENSEAVLAAVEDLQSEGKKAPARNNSKGRILLFTGHMIDAPDRETKRFPQEKEEIAREEIKKMIQAELEAGDIEYGIAGGASGGDILFHELCEGFNIPTNLFLVMPKIDFIKASVMPAGANWIERFNRLYDRHEENHSLRVLRESDDLPKWLLEKSDYGIWQRSNLWMLYNAKTDAGDGSVTLIALWDGEKGDGPGGTEDLIKRARDYGLKSLIIDSKKAFDL